MITVEEKLKLMEEVGASTAAWTIRNKQKMDATIARMTAMKFKVTSKKEIAQKIGTHFYFNFGSHSIPVAALGLVIGMLLSMIPCVVLKMSPIWGVATAVAGTMIGAILGLTGVSEIVVERLDSWKWDLPYGALLAVKEAKEKGMGSFHIHYPATDNHARLLKDPVITATHGDPYGMGSVIFEVFSWDDGKVYE